jgi:hypothetical protein
MKQSRQRVEWQQHRSLSCVLGGPANLLHLSPDGCEYGAGAGAGVLPFCVEHSMQHVRLRRRAREMLVSIRVPA